MIETDTDSVEDGTELQRPEQLPDEVYRIEDNDPPDVTKCSNFDRHERGEMPPAVWRIDMRDPRGNFFAAVCNDDECIEEFAEFIEEQRSKDGTAVLEGVADE